MFPVTWIVAGRHLSPVTWLIVSCIEAPRLRVSRFLVSYSCVIVPGIVVPGIVPGTSRCAAITIPVAAISRRLIEAAIAATIARRLPTRFLRRDLRRAIRRSSRAGGLHVRSVELGRLGRRRYRRTSVVFRREQLPVLAGGMFMLSLRCQRRVVRLATKPFFLRRGPRSDTAPAVEAYIPRVIHDHRPVVYVRHIGHIHIRDRAVVEKGATSPLTAVEAAAAVSETIVDAAVEADMRPPITRVPAIEAIREGPVARRPQHAHRRNHPCARDPVVAVVVTPRPITRSPEIARTGTQGLSVHWQRRRTDSHRDANPNLRMRCRRERQHRNCRHQNSEYKPEYQPMNGAFHFRSLSCSPIILAEDRRTGLITFRPYEP